MASGGRCAGQPHCAPAYPASRHSSGLGLEDHTNSASYLLELFAHSPIHYIRLPATPAALTPQCGLFWLD